jgi:CBS-domain-containing membrane protein
MLGALHQYVTLPRDLVAIIPSMGASVVLLFSATASPLAQPWNTIVGHCTAAFVGVAVRAIFIHVWFLKPLVWLSGGLAVSIAICCMQLLHAVRITLLS